MLTYAELESFFTGLVDEAQRRGITCAITSGMACVHFGIAATTKDCDLLCAPAAAKKFLSLLEGTTLAGLPPTYRGHLSPPLDARWMRGGWTAHFTWKTKPEETCLDVFGAAPRASGQWEHEIEGRYVSRQVVAEMKRTNRLKDWPCITGIGIKLLKRGDERGWLHVFDGGALQSFRTEVSLPSQFLLRRPSLTLLDDDRLDAALHAEQIYWEKLDACRIRVYERALRPYVSAVRKAVARRPLPLNESHALRVECALEKLIQRPLHDYGIARLIEEARATTAEIVHPALLNYLPNAVEHFIFPD
jgi:hypothetical protein